jgi:ribonucleoside-diphosphate reductase subunit M2
MKAEIYGASWCSYCENAVALCESNGITFDYIDVDVESNLKDLEERVGGRIKSVPQIFLDGKFVPGGFTGLRKELQKG